MTALTHLFHATATDASVAAVLYAATVTVTAVAAIASPRRSGDVTPEKPLRSY